MKKHLIRTWKNKVVAMILGMLGVLSFFISGEATAFAFFAIIFAIPLFFAKHNYIDL